jgi:hypothetical protein
MGFPANMRDRGNATPARQATGAPRPSAAPQAAVRLIASGAMEVLDLKERLRCRGCGAKGRAVVSIKWRGGAGDRLLGTLPLGLVRPDRDCQAP